MNRKGIILPIVLVMFLLLGMLALAFSFSARAEYSALGARMTMDQARDCAISGIESSALRLRQKFDDPHFWYHKPEVFADQVVDVESGRRDTSNSWRFSLIGYNLDDQETVRYGLTDEAGKLNLNVASEDQLKRLPGVTAEMAAALLDWREKGDKPREGGAKDEYYMSLEQPYRCKQAPLDTVEELLLVKGFTAKELFGEDMNRNGQLDPNENDGKRSLPVDNQDGKLDRGLYPFVTVYSREPEVCDSDPYQPRMNIKSWPAALLTTMLTDKLRPEVLQYIISAKSANKDFGNSPASLLGEEKGESGTKDNSDNVTSQPGTGEEQSVGSSSPVTADDLEDIMDLLTTGYHLHDDGSVYGRINVNTAPRTVLATLGRLTDSEIDQIISVRNRLDASSLRTTAWLVKQNVLTSSKYKTVAGLLTARSYQFTVESVGYCEGRPTQARIQAVLELRLPRVQYLYWRDLTSLGRAYNLGGIGEAKIAIKR